MIIYQDTIDLQTPTGEMRVYQYAPKHAGIYPGIIFYSEIFQQTEPIRRMASFLAGHGFIVLVPEVFHELNPIGTVLGYDDLGKDKGNQDKFTKSLEGHDSDTSVLVDYLQGLGYCNKKIGTMGVCLGGHLAFRAALHSDVLSACCLYATDIHSGTIPSEEGNDSLTRSVDIKGEIQMIFGRQDPHVPSDGRLTIYKTLSNHHVNFTWHEFNAQHAFMRDEGERYDPQLATICNALALDLFSRTLK